MPTAIARRAYGLPESHDYRDEGCDAYTACLSCPFPRCRYDVPGGIRMLRLRARNAAIREAHDAGEPVAELARRYGLGTRRARQVVDRG